MSEQVMVVESAELRPLLHQGLIRRNAAAIVALIEQRPLFIPRPVAEVSPQYRQIIPYVVICHGEDLFVLRRTPKQTEARLHHKLSLGIGGHINPGHSLMEGLQKELTEEVLIEDEYSLQFAGVVNDETTEVGSVHLGIVYLLIAGGKRVSVVETEKMTGEWIAPSALGGLREAMESWSQIVYDELFVAVGRFPGAERPL